MIVETSVLVAIVLQEPGFEEFVFKIAEADEQSVSAANYLEASLVLLQRRGEGALLELDRVIGEMELAIVPVTSAQVRIARGRSWHTPRVSVTRRSSILETGSGMRWRSRQASRCCSRVMTSLIRMC